MNKFSETMNDDISHIKQWILAHLQKECDIEEISFEIPLIEQLDSFQVIGFLVACDEEFQSLRQSGTEAFAGLSIDKIAIYIANKNKTSSKDHS